MSTGHAFFLFCLQSIENWKKPHAVTCLFCRRKFLVPVDDGSFRSRTCQRCLRQLRDSARHDTAITCPVEAFQTPDDSRVYAHRDAG